MHEGSERRTGGALRQLAHRGDQDDCPFDEAFDYRESISHADLKPGTVVRFATARRLAFELRIGAQDPLWAHGVLREVTGNTDFATEPSREVSIFCRWALSQGERPVFHTERDDETFTLTLPSVSLLEVKQPSWWQRAG
jgi:hypothetical protein